MPKWFLAVFGTLIHQLFCIRTSTLARGKHSWSRGEVNKSSNEMSRWFIGSLLEKIMCISNLSLLIFSFHVLCFCIGEESLSHWGISINVLMCFCSSHLLQLWDDEIVHLGLAEIVEHFFYSPRNTLNFLVLYRDLLTFDHVSVNIFHISSTPHSSFPFALFIFAVTYQTNVGYLH